MPTNLSGMTAKPKRLISMTRRTVPYSNRLERAARVACCHIAPTEPADRWPWYIAAPVIGLLAAIGALVWMAL